MGFFKDFADDFSEAIDELTPGGGNAAEKRGAEERAVEETLDTDLDVANELSKLDGLLEKASRNVDSTEKVVAAELTPPVEREPVVEAAPAPAAPIINQKETIMEEKLNLDTTPKAVAQEPVAAFDSAPVSDENAVITGGMRITGDLESTGSIEVEGTINGNVRCNGKLTVTGTINGNSTSSEFFADSAKVQGEVSSSGTVKIGVGSVVIGNISATSAVIAGAVKGDIDVQGPVVVDTSAVVMGNIKSRSVQINNGAVIEGFCSQAYAEVDVESVFA